MAKKIKKKIIIIIVFTYKNCFPLISATDCIPNESAKYLLLLQNKSSKWRPTQMKTFQEDRYQKIPQYLGGKLWSFSHLEVQFL